LALVAQRLTDLGRIRERSQHGRILDVEDPKSIRRSLPPRLVVQRILMLVEPRL
jgi:hypothetical protein